MPRQKRGKVLERLPALAPSGLACGFVDAASFGLPDASDASVNCSKFRRRPLGWSGLERFSCEERRGERG